ncbi:hypothetical protein ACSMXN_16895 [Jatrophihabitans sp. DSM 45814]
MTADARIEELAQLLRDQQVEIERLQRTIATRGATADSPRPDSAALSMLAPAIDGPEGDGSSRRRFFKLAGATAVGAAGVALLKPGEASAAEADPYPQYVLDTGDTITGKLAVTGAASANSATEIGDAAEHALTVFANTGGIEIDSKSKQRIRMQAQTRWDSDDDGLVGSGFNINNPATVWRQTGENHKGALLEIQQWLEAGPHEAGAATNHPGTTFNVPKADFYKIGWITAHYDSPNPVDTIHQHMNFETCNADLKTKITRFQISWGEDIALCSFVNSNVRLIYTDKLLTFGSAGQVAATYTDATGRLDFTGHPVSFTAKQLQVAGTPVAPTLFARKPVDEHVVSWAQLQSDNDLGLTLTPNSTYTFSAFLNWSSDPAADLRLAWQVPADATIVWTPDGLGTTAATATGEPKRSVNGSEAVSMGGVGAAVKLAATPTGIIRTGATAGEVRLLWAQNVTHPSTSTLYADSYLQLTRVV